MEAAGGDVQAAVERFFGGGTPRQEAGGGGVDELIARFERADRMRESGDARGALAEFEGCLAQARGLGNRQAEGAVLGELGSACGNLGRHDEAVTLNAETLGSESFANI